ncbi:MAG: CooT family nickel-binding protein [Eggerthellaceae bacterium]|nr:CooT family nickel-binding protein [Eggerthellaceae bacterium]
MCLSNVYDRTADAEHLLVKNVQNFRMENGQLVFTDLMEREYAYPASLVSADLVGGQVVIALEKGGE